AALQLSTARGIYPVVRVQWVSARGGDQNAGVKFQGPLLCRSFSSDSICLCLFPLCSPHEPLRLGDPTLKFSNELGRSQGTRLVPLPDNLLAPCPQLGHFDGLGELRRLNPLHPFHQRDQGGALGGVGYWAVVNGPQG